MKYLLNLKGLCTSVHSAIHELMLRASIAPNVIDALRDSTIIANGSITVLEKVITGGFSIP